MTEYNRILSDFTISLGLFVVALVAMVGVVVYQYNSVNTSDWFAPTGTLEVHHNGTGQTVNPQLTVDGATLQGAGL